MSNTSNAASATTSGDTQGLTLLTACRIPAPSIAKVHTSRLTPIQAAGIRYERRVIKALRAQGYEVQANPWYKYKYKSQAQHVESVEPLRLIDENTPISLIGENICSADAVLRIPLRAKPEDSTPKRKSVGEQASGMLSANIPSAQSLGEPQRTLLLIVEIKRTWVPDAAQKLRDLYMPVIALAEHAAGTAAPTVAAMVVCQNLRRDAPQPCLSLYDAIRRVQEGFLPTLLWPGQGPI